MPQPLGRSALLFHCQDSKMAVPKRCPLLHEDRISNPPQKAGEDPAPIRSTDQLESHRGQHISLRQHRRATLDENVESGEFRCFFRHIDILNPAVC